MKRGIFYTVGIIGMLLIALGALAGSGKAQFNSPQTIREVCITNTTLRTEINATLCIDGDCDVYSKQSDTLCTSGQCDSVQNKCSPDELTANIYIVVIIIVIVIGLIILARYF